MRTTNAATAAASSPERWRTSVGEAALAVLVIPAHATRQRRFEISCAMTVAVPPDATPQRCWHEMSVLANGEKQWRRRVPSHNPDAFDGLDYRFTCSVPVGRALHLSVAVQVRGVRRRSVDVEAEEC